ncbi:MAG: hypothetical protein JSS50_01720 [Proteobacteria bacterium]|nr:hypothetical protein [Pseudomonadota bacterium]
MHVQWNEMNYRVAYPYREFYHERAGIYQYDAVVSPVIAEEMARNDVLNLWLEHEYSLAGHHGMPSLEFKRDNYLRGMQELQKYGAW